jgi:topoisomerase IA-like protein
VEEAVNVIDEQISAKKRKEEVKSEIIQVGKYEIKKGPYGFYFTFNKKNYWIGQKDPANLTENDCREIMSSKKEWEKTKSAKSAK